MRAPVPHERTITIMTLVIIITGWQSECSAVVPKLPSTTSEISDCQRPVFHDCSVTVLTAPLHENFSTYCIIESSTQSGPLTHSNWTKPHVTFNASRTSVNATGGAYVRNVSIKIQDMRESDGGTYILEAANSCGKSNFMVVVVIENGGCYEYEPPNATHIFSYTAVEGRQFKILCDFNGDVTSVHYDPQWNKGSQRDIVFNGPKNKYSSSKTTNCAAPCCSFSDLLVVSNATQNDSDLYTCLAWPVASGSPAGSNLSIYIVVIPQPKLLSQPQDFSTSEGEVVELSCEVQGFSNSTAVSWRKNLIDLNTTALNGYHTERQGVNDTVFVEVLSFTADSDKEGRYSCCIGLEADNLVASAEELKCGLKYGTVSVEKGKTSVMEYAPVAGGVILLLVVLVVFVWWARRPSKKGGYQPLVNKKEASLDYGSIDCRPADQCLVAQRPSSRYLCPYKVM